MEHVMYTGLLTGNFTLHKTIEIMTTVLTDANFNAQVLASDKLCVVDFWATWCPPCIALGPTMEALAKDYEGRVIVGKLNADENPEVSLNYGVTNLPCILFIKNGQVVDKHIGAASKAVYDKKIRNLLTS